MNRPDSDPRIPKEILDFFGQTGGRSLLVIGGPGTGKTTFALQLLEEMGDPRKSFYLTTRVSDQALYEQFPWLREEDMRNRIIDASRVFLSTLHREEDSEAPTMSQEEMERLQSAKEFLRTIEGEPLTPPHKVDRTRLSVLLERNRMPEIERIYDRVDAILPEKAMLVIDSIEGVTCKYGLEKEELITCIQKDLVEGSNVNTVYILERDDDGGLGFLVDGVARFVHDTLNGRRVRELQLIKLRATEISQPAYLVTLKDGRFMSFEPFNGGVMKGEKSEWKPIPDSPTHYSTGIPDLDLLLGGGYAKGSYNVIEVDHNVSPEEYYAVVRPILLNFISQGRGVIAVLTGGEHPDTLRKDLTAFIPEEVFDRSVRIADYFAQKSDAPYVMALGTRHREDALRTWKNSLEYLRGPDNKPIIDFTGFDTIEYLRGDTIAIQELLSAVSKIKVSQDLGIGVIKPGLKLTQEIMNMADTYLKIIDINKSPCIYGIKPKTIIYGIVADEEKGPPHIKLVPIV